MTGRRSDTTKSIARRYRVPALPGVDVWMAGDGPPLVLLPGWGLSGPAYRRTMQAIGALGRRVIVPRLALGPDAAWSLDAAASLAAQAAAALDADPAPVIGHSFGGAVAMAYAAEHPDMVSSLVLVDAVGVSPGRLRLARLALPGRQWRVGANGPTAVSLIRNVMAPGGWASLVGSAKWIMSQNLAAQMKVIRDEAIPRTVLWAEDESVLPVEVGRQLARTLDCSFHVVRASKGWPDTRKPDHDWPVRAPMFFARRVVHHINELESPRRQTN